MSDPVPGCSRTFVDACLCLMMILFCTGAMVAHAPLGLGPPFLLVPCHVTCPKGTWLLLALGLQSPHALPLHMHYPPCGCQAQLSLTFKQTAPGNGA